MNMKSKLENDNRKKMLLTNYSFFSALLNKKLSSPMRWYIENGISHPKTNNKYFKDFQDFFIKKIKENKIEVIYTAKPAGVSFLKDMLGDKEFQNISIDQIIKIVTSKMNLPERFIKGKSRRKEIALARQIIMYLSRELTSFPLSTIGLKVGRRDHSTVVHACKTIENKMNRELSFKKMIDDFLNSLSKKY